MLVVKHCKPVVPRRGNVKA